MANRKQVFVIYHSTYGHTERLARAVAQGVAAEADVDAVLRSTDQACGDWEALNRADALVFGCPTYMGSVSAGFKNFMELSSPLWAERRWKDKVAAGFTTSASPSGDKLSTLVQLAVFAAQHGMVWVGQDALPSAAQNRLGSFLGLMAQSPSDQGPDVAPPEEDLATARDFGRRIAAVTKAFGSPA
jgi:multimeric flavodoxin WrbA